MNKITLVSYSPLRYRTLPACLLDDLIGLVSPFVSNEQRPATDIYDAFEHSLCLRITGTEVMLYGGNAHLIVLCRCTTAKTGGSIKLMLPAKSITALTKILRQGTQPKPLGHASGCPNEMRRWLGVLYGHKIRAALPAYPLHWLNAYERAQNVNQPGRLNDVIAQGGPYVGKFLDLAGDNVGVFRDEKIYVLKTEVQSHLLVEYLMLYAIPQTIGG